MSKRKLNQRQQQRIAENQSAPAADTELGLVIGHYGQEIEVLPIPGLDTLNNKTSINANTLRCHFRANLETVVVGDKVYWQRLAPTKSDAINGAVGGVIESICERNSLLLRPRPYEQPKPVAANIDQVMVVISPQPEPKSTLIDRYLIAAENAGLSTALVINKTDLLPDLSNVTSEELEFLSGLYRSLDYEVIEHSCVTGDASTALADKCAGRATILVGQSGVGKSSIINYLEDKDLAETGDVSTYNTRGKHTTTTSRLYFLQRGGILIDSPGIREFGLWHLDETSIIDGLPEFRERATQCRFRDCQHGKSKGCAIQAAIDDGDIHPSRAASYATIIASLDEK